MKIAAVAALPLLAVACCEAPRAADEPPAPRTTITRHYQVTSLDEAPSAGALERVVVVFFDHAGRKLREVENPG